MPGKHALLSASSSHRWLACPPSAKLCAGADDKGSEYAQQGTDAHALCEYKLLKALGRKADNPTENLTFFDEEMDSCSGMYVQFVLEQLAAAKESCSDPVVMVEQHLDFSQGCLTVLVLGTALLFLTVCCTLSTSSMAWVCWWRQSTIRS